VYAIALIVLILLAVLVSVLAYQKVFTSTIPVVLKADRAGLQMHPGNRVKVQGVDLGRVEKIELSPDQRSVDITLFVDPELAAQIPVNVVADLNQLTAFGNKAVDLTMPPTPSSEHLRAGSVIQAHHVAGEINGTFDQLTTVLNEIQPAKLNAVLGAFAQTLQGNGDSLGETLTTANAYLKKFNNDLPDLQRDFRQTAGFANVYGDSAKDIADLVRNAGIVSTVFRDGEWPRLLNSVDSVGGALEDFSAANAVPLNGALSSLLPTTSLLKKYSPMLTCLIDGAAQTWEIYNNAMALPGGYQFEAAFVPGPKTYKYPEDLPQPGPGAMKPGPDCHGLPKVTPSETALSDTTPGPPSLAPGTQTNTPKISKQPALVQMFGPNAYVPRPLRAGGR